MSRTLDSGRLADDLVRLLQRGPTTATEACRALSISQSSFSRLIAANGDRVVALGRARATRYLARRGMEGIPAPVPIFEAGDGVHPTRQVAWLHPVEPRGYCVEGLVPDVATALHPDLPWFLDDLRPAGFLGRLVPGQHPDLEAPTDIRSWSDAHTLRYLVRHAWDGVGSLIVGEQACRLFLERVRQVPDQVAVDGRENAYAQRALAALRLSTPGSSAGGEQPKFLATVVDKAEATPVLVKYSPAASDAAAVRLRDLLLSEHVAHAVMERHGHQAVRSRLLQGGGRLFLEIDRFDRHGPLYRMGAVSLAALDAEFVGSALTTWSATSAALLRQGRLDAAIHRAIRWRECFGRLIANTDMHPHNLSLFTRGTRITGLAPAYDMLPMAYAPASGEVFDRPFDPPLPSPADADVWPGARGAALDYWRSLEGHEDLSPGFRAIAARDAHAVEALSDVEALLPKR